MAPQKVQFFTDSNEMTLEFLLEIQDVNMETEYLKNISTTDQMNEHFGKV